MKHLLINAKAEILALRRENEILQAKVGTMELFADMLHVRGPKSVSGMAPDICICAPEED